jgi:hypothetical protein
MALKAIIAKLDEVPEALRGEYVQKGDKFVLQVEGMKTQADVEAVQRALQNERAQHNETTTKLKEANTKLEAFGDKTPEQITELADKLATLEAAGTPELTKNFEKIVNDRVEAVLGNRVKAATDKITKDFTTLQTTHQQVVEENSKLKQSDTLRTIDDAVRSVAVKNKLLDTAVTDALMRAHTTFEVQDGKVVTKDGKTPEEWIEERKQDAAHWWPVAKGAGAGGSDGRGGYVSGDNPWTKEGWNITKQGQMIREDASKAERFAAQAGSKVGATTPPK